MSAHEANATALIVLGTIAAGLMVWGLAMWARDCRREEAERQAKVEALLAQHRMENVGRLVTFPQQTLNEAMAADVIEEAEMLCRLDSWEFGS